MTLSLPNTSTVAALATALGPSGVAVIRLSGPEALPIAQRLFSHPNRLKAGRIAHGWLQDAFAPGCPRIDEIVALTFKAPHSFTGDDVVELHTHGGTYLPLRALQLCYQAGAQPAQPGEFTQRAFSNGKLSLVQAEAVADLIAADGEGLARSASVALQTTGLTQRLAGLRSALSACYAQIVAATDYPDEVDEPPRDQLVAALQPVLSQGQALAAASARNQVWRTGATVALLGRPNAGKSSLFNALLASDRAIVTPMAGTTRDLLSEQYRLPGCGITLTLQDTAGLRQGTDEAEQQGIQRSWQAAGTAHALFYLLEARYLLPGAPLPEEDQEALASLSPETPVRVVASQVDRLSAAERAALPSTVNGLAVTPCSSVTGEGVATLTDWLEALYGQHQLHQLDVGQLVAFNQRQTACLQQFIENTQLAIETLAQAHYPLDLASVPLSEALYGLQRLTGEDTTEALLDEVFSRFCVGK